MCSNAYRYMALDHTVVYIFHGPTVLEVFLDDQSTVHHMFTDKNKNTYIVHHLPPQMPSPQQIWKLAAKA
jgi:hypothetical protein